jgi:uncharacterized protein YuzB (UPF0349 family)
VLHHVIQEDMFGEFGFMTLMNAVRETGIPHTLVKITPFTHELTPEVTAAGPFTVWGSTALGTVAEERKWVLFKNDNFDMRVLKEKFGSDYLNSDAEFCNFGDVQPFVGLRFMRPVFDNKAFTGKIIDGEEFEYWRDGMYNKVAGFNVVNCEPDTPVLIADPKNIRLEARFFVVDGRIITGSSYRSLGRQCIYQRIDSNAPLYAPMYEFALQMLKKWQPIIAYVIDIAQVDDEFKVIEINCINHSGFYACDMAAVLRAITALPY